MSYGLYLFHRPIMRIGTGIELDGQLLAVLVMVLLSLGVSWLSWRYVERPFLQLKRRWGAPRRATSDELRTPAHEPVPVLADR